MFLWSNKHQGCIEHFLGLSDRFFFQVRFQVLPLWSFRNLASSQKKRHPFRMPNTGVPGKPNCPRHLWANLGWRFTRFLLGWLLAQQKCQQIMEEWRKGGKNKTGILEMFLKVGTVLDRTMIKTIQTLGILLGTKIDKPDQRIVRSGFV